jgi:hypothetical protein
VNKRTIREAAELQRSDTARILAEIEARVRPTICHTFSVEPGKASGGSRMEGRISADDFDTLRILAGAALFVHPDRIAS